MRSTARQSTPRPKRLASPRMRRQVGVAVALRCALALGGGLALSGGLALGGAPPPFGLGLAQAAPAHPARLSHRAQAQGRSQRLPRGRRSLASRVHRASGRKVSRRGTAHHLAVNTRRAIAAFDAMQRRFYIGGAGLYRGASSTYSYLWPFSQALAATVSIASIPGQQAPYARQLHLRLEGLATYWGVTSGLAEAGASPAAMPSYTAAPTASEGAGTTGYYDDNEWVAIELARIYSLDGDPSALQSAEQVMAFVMAGWQESSGLACPGGVPFSDSPHNTERNTVTDAPAAELGVLLYELTKQASYLQFAQRAYSWVRACLLEPQQLYADHIGPSGRVNHALWSYNQGAMIGAGTLLYQATGDPDYLGEARQTAQAALARFTVSQLETENPFFAAVYLRNLLYLDSVTHDPSGAALAQEYADDAWRNLRMSGTGLFVFGAPPEPTLLGQAAIAQVYALLSEPQTSYF